MEPKTIVFPLEDFEFIALPIAENKETGRERI
jgi:hypothetical protein